jgi:thiosulfate/3-mercaptopyruvate sulfurtransferase
MKTLMILLLAYARPEMLVDTGWLTDHLNDPGIRIVDMRTQGYEAGHLPGAVHLANAAIRDAKHPPEFLPSREAFERTMSELGISNSTRVIAYDERGGIYAARLWWILHYYGHSNVALLNGGWVKWKAENRAINNARPRLKAGNFQAKPDPHWIATAEDVVGAIGKAGMKIVDARTRAEIDGKDLRGIKHGGHIPGSIPLYWEDALDPATLAFRPASELEKLVKDRGIASSDEVIAYCQVGMRASVDLFVLRLLGYDKLRNYYGAWEEWGNRDDLPIVKPGP